MRAFKIEAGDANRRADKFLFQLCPNLPKSAVYKAFRNKKIKKNGKRCPFDALLLQNDLIEIYLSDEAFTRQKEAAGHGDASFVSPLFENENYLILNKPVGIAVQPGKTKNGKNLVDSVSAYLHAEAGQTGFHPSPCSRLDTNTGGVLVFAKNAAAARAYANAQQNQQIEKDYLCICIGSPKKKKDLLRAFWKKDGTENMVTVSATEIPDSKPIATEYTVLTEEQGLSLLRLRLITGRSHQIRAQMAAIGCPVLGDNKYGNRLKNKLLGVKFQCLTAYRLTFLPVLSQDLMLAPLAGQTITAPLPEEFKSRFPRQIKP